MSERIPARRRSFKNLDVDYVPGLQQTTLYDKELGWKYFIPIYDTPRKVAAELVRIAAWLREVDDKTRIR